MSAVPVENGQPKAALRGEPSYVWRAGQERRMAMILEAAGDRVRGDVLVNGCGVGMYAEHLALQGGQVVGLDIEFDRVQIGHRRGMIGLNAMGEALPFPNASFDLILSHEVLEHVQDDRRALREMARALKDRGRIILFVPNRGYPFETHGVYWQGEYHFGNIPLVNYLPRAFRDRLAPHVRVYTRADLAALLANLPVRVVVKKVIFGAYDNLIARWPRLGRGLRDLLHRLEGTPLRVLGLSHFWVVEKVPVDPRSSN